MAKKISWSRSSRISRARSRSLSTFLSTKYSASGSPQLLGSDSKSAGFVSPSGPSRSRSPDTRCSWGRCSVPLRPFPEALNASKALFSAILTAKPSHVPSRRSGRYWSSPNSASERTSSALTPVPPQDSFYVACIVRLTRLNPSASSRIPREEGLLDLGVHDVGDFIEALPVCQERVPGVECL